MPHRAACSGGQDQGCAVRQRSPCPVERALLQGPGRCDPQGLAHPDRVGPAGRLDARAASCVPVSRQSPSPSRGPPCFALRASTWLDGPHPRR